MRFNPYILALVGVALAWGSTFFIIKNTVEVVNEYLIVFLRSAVAAVFMILYLLKKETPLLLHKKAIYQGAILGFLLAFTYNSQTIGLKYTSSGHSAFITGAAVIMVPILLFVFYRQKLTLNKLLALVIVLLGLFLLTFDTQTKINKGDLITLLTALSAAGHIVVSGRNVKKTPVLPLVTYQFVFTALFSLLGWIIQGAHYTAISNQSWLALIYLGIVGTLFCYFVSVWAQKYVSSTNVALIFSLEPVFAAIFGYFTLHEVLNTTELTGAALIISGILYYEYSGVLKKMLR